jgi:hypothetical protein
LAAKRGCLEPEDEPMKRILMLTAALIVGGTIASAAIDTEALVSALQADGYTRVEVKVGPTQTKVEATNGDRKVETVYDNETGQVLKSETELVRAGEDISPGVEVRTTDRDFVGDDDHGGRGRDHDEDDDDHGGHDDDDDDHDSDDDHGDHDSDHD